MFIVQQKIIIILSLPQYYRMHDVYLDKNTRHKFQHTCHISPQFYYYLRLHSILSFFNDPTDLQCTTNPLVVMVNFSHLQFEVDNYAMVKTPYTFFASSAVMNLTNNNTLL